MAPSTVKANVVPGKKPPSGKTPGKKTITKPGADQPKITIDKSHVS